MPGPETASRPSPGARPAPPPAPDTASEVMRWAAFSCVLVPVVLVWFGTSLAGAAGTALGLAAVTGACLVLLRQSERGAARMRAEERAPHRARHGRSGPRERGPRERTQRERESWDPGGRPGDPQGRHGRNPEGRSQDARGRDMRDREARVPGTGPAHDRGPASGSGPVPGSATAPEPAPGPAPRPVPGSGSATVPAPGAHGLAETHIVSGLPGRSGPGAHRGGRRGAGKKPVD